MSDEGRSAENQTSLATSFLYGGNGIYIESQYEKWQANPNSVDKSWADFFATIGENDGLANGHLPSWARKDWPPRDNSELIALIDGDWSGLELKAAKKAPIKAEQPADTTTVLQATRDSIKAIMMIRAFRIRGHLAAKLDPLGLNDFREPQPELDPATYGFTEQDMDRPIFIDFVLGLEYATPRQIIEILQRTYCSNLGLEFMHVSNPEEKNWLQARIEGEDKGISFTPEGKKSDFE